MLHIFEQTLPTFSIGGWYPWAKKITTFSSNFMSRATCQHPRANLVFPKNKLCVKINDICTLTHKAEWLPLARNAVVRPKMRARETPNSLVKCPSNVIQTPTSLNRGLAHFDCDGDRNLHIHCVATTGEPNQQHLENPALSGRPFQTRAKTCSVAGENTHLAVVSEAKQANTPADQHHPSALNCRQDGNHNAEEVRHGRISLWHGSCAVDPWNLKIKWNLLSEALR